MASRVSKSWILVLLLLIVIKCVSTRVRERIIYSDNLDDDNTDTVDHPVFPLYGALFLPYNVPNGVTTENGEHYMATMDSVRPILDVAMSDAHRRYLRHWVPRRKQWLRIAELPVGECSDQRKAAWAALQAVQWTNGSGLDVSFGPACDYILASVARILSFHNVVMFSNAGFSEFFQNKTELPISRVGPQQDSITRMIHRMTLHFEWKNPCVLYEKHFWKSELHEAGFCKLLMNGMYKWTVEKKWNVSISPHMIPHNRDDKGRRERIKEELIQEAGSKHGATLKMHRVACGV